MPNVQPGQQDGAAGAEQNQGQQQQGSVGYALGAGLHGARRSRSVGFAPGSNNFHDIYADMQQAMANQGPGSEDGEGKSMQP